MTQHKTPQQIADEYVNTVTVKTLSGDKQYCFILLKRKVAAQVHYQTLNVIIEAVIKLYAAKDFSAQALINVTKVLDFETLWGLGEKLLEGATINGVGIDFEDYFGKNPDELICAIFYGIKVNYPEVFSKARAKLRALDLSGLQKKLGMKLNMDSVDELSKIFKSPSSTESTLKK